MFFTSGIYRINFQQNFRRKKPSQLHHRSRDILVQLKPCASPKMVIILQPHLATTKCASGIFASSSFSRPSRFPTLLKSATSLSTSLELICPSLATMSAFSKSKNGMRLIRIFDNCLNFIQICRYTAHTDDVTSSSWGALATELVTCSLDRTVKVFSLEDGQGSKFA